METTRERTPSMVQRRTFPWTKWLSPHWLVLGVSLVMQGSALAGYQFMRVDAANPDATYLLGVNNSGQIVGTIYDDEGRHRHGFEMDRLGGYGAIDFPDATDSQATGINADGLIVGGYFDGSRTHGFVFNGGYTTIDAPDMADTQPSGINGLGQIVGTYSPGGFLLSDGEFTTLRVPGASTTGAAGINDAGEIVGSCRFSFVESPAFVRSVDDQYQVFSMPDADFTFANGINNVGQVVGTFRGSGGYRGFLWQDGVVTTVDFPGASDTYATGINDDGLIVGYFADPQGFHGFLATPR